MQVTVSGRHIDVGQALREHVETELEAAVSKYFEKAMEATVTFAKINAVKSDEAFHAEISVHVGRGILLQGTAEAADPYVAFNTASEKIAKRLRRYKRRLRDHHANQTREVEELIAQQYILNDNEADAAEAEGGDIELEDAGTEPAIIAEMTTNIESLTVSEAVMRMDLAESPALMFRNAAHSGLNMVYRRTDGNIGWVDPRGTRGGK